MSKKIESMVIWFIIISGFLLPWGVGIGMKLYLDSQGLPTWDWLYFFHPASLLAEIWATIWFAAPSLFLGMFAYLLFNSRLRWAQLLKPWEKSTIVVVSAVWGAAGSIPVFIRMFRFFDPVSLVFPFFHTIDYVDDYLFGLLAGICLATVLYSVRRLSHRIKL